MHQLIQFTLAVLVLVLGIPIGDLLAKYTQEELKSGKKWFLLIIFLSIVGIIFALASGKDYLLFSLLFISIVTSRSLK